VCLVDVGGGTSDIAVFAMGAIRHTAVVPIAGDQITTTSRWRCVRLPPKPKQLKVRHGCALRQLAEAGPDDRGRGRGRRRAMLSRQTLAEVIEPRVEELYSSFSRCCATPVTRNCCPLGGRAHGGSAVMQGMVESWERERSFTCRVRLGIPRYTGSLSDVVRTRGTPPVSACCLRA